MFSIGNKIVYRDEVCTVVGIDEKYRDNEDYLVLSSSRDDSLTIRVPERVATKLTRPLITKTEIEALIKKIPNIKTIPISSWGRGAEYKELLSKGCHESIIKIIKTAYVRNQERADKRQKSNESDKQYFRQAERILYEEIAASLDIDYDDAREYIVSRVASFGVA